MFTDSIVSQWKIGGRGWEPVPAFWMLGVGPWVARRSVAFRRVLRVVWVVYVSCWWWQRFPLCALGGLQLDLVVVYVARQVLLR